MPFRIGDSSQRRGSPLSIHRWYSTTDPPADSTGPVALRHVELLDLLERVARRADHESLAHDVVEIHEHAAAQQVVHLGLAGGVLAHEPLDRRLLVGGVVVDVERRVPPAPLDQPVDEPLERRALLPLVVRPPVVVDRA